MVSWADFTIQAVATLIGVVIGIPVALWLNRKYSEYKKRGEKKSLMDFLKQNLEENLRLIQDMKNHFSKGMVIYYNVDLAGWPILSQKIHLLDNIELKKKIFRVYYKLEHLSRKIDRQFEMHYSAFRAIKNYNKDRVQLVGSIIQHIDIIKKEIKEILNELLYRDYYLKNKNMNNNKESNLIDIDGKRLSGLLKNLEILENHIFINAKISYDTALGSLASIVLISVYAYITDQLSLFSAIPFIIFVGGIIYLHIMRLDMEYDAYGMKIEDKINELLRSNIINQIHDLGVFSKAVKASHYIKLVLPFALGYILSAYFGVKSIVADKGVVVGFYFLIAYLVMLVFFVLTGYSLKHKYNDLYQELFSNN